MLCCSRRPLSLEKRASQKRLKGTSNNWGLRMRGNWQLLLGAPCLSPSPGDEEQMRIPGIRGEGACFSSGRGQVGKLEDKSSLGGSKVVVGDSKKIKCNCGVMAPKMREIGLQLHLVMGGRPGRIRGNLEIHTWLQRWVHLEGFGFFGHGLVHQEEGLLGEMEFAQGSGRRTSMYVGPQPSEQGFQLGSRRDQGRSPQVSEDQGGGSHVGSLNKVIGGILAC